MSGRTPGPWQVHSEQEPLQIVGNVDGPDEGRMHFTRICELHDTSEADGNARLIAAAPDLLDALVVIEEYWNRDRNDQAMFDACWYAVETARAAIAKATGKELAA